MVQILKEGYYKISLKRQKQTHTYRGCFECVVVADHLYLHLRFPPFVSLQLSVSSLSVCFVFFASSSSPSFILPQSLLFTSSKHFFFPLCLLSLSFYSFPFPAFLSESFPGLLFLSLLTGAFLVFPPTHLLVFSFNLYPPFSLCHILFSPHIFSSVFLSFSHFFLCVSFPLQYP